MTGRRVLPGAACALLLLAALGACQGTSPSGAGARPRSKLSAGEQEALPFETDISKRQGITSSGGELEYRSCKISIPVGALEKLTFVEISLPQDPPVDVIGGSAYLISPDGQELTKDALLQLTYKEADLPPGEKENDLAIVQLVSGVWVELPNQEVHTFKNSLDAPIRYFGLYALRIRKLDPRSSNAMPTASFEWSTKPYAASNAPSVKPKEDEAPAPELGPDGTPIAPPADGSPPATGAPPANGAPPATGGQAVAPPKAGSTTGRPGQIRERMLVAGPQGKDEAAPPTDNVAEGESPGEPKDAGDAEPLTESPAADAEPEKEGLTGVTIYFDASQSEDPDGQVTQYDWDFDCDGIFDFTSHKGPYAKHAFRTNGDYSVILKVTDNGRYPQAGYGSSLVKVRSPKAEAGGLSANIAAYPPSGPCPLLVTFGSAVSGGTPPYTYNWTFSDGSKSKIGNPFTTYVESGDKVVSFSVTDVMGDTISGSVTATVCDHEGPQPPQERLLVDVAPVGDRGVAPLTSHFTFITERGTGLVTYRVLFGDEAEDEDETVTTSTTLDHTYTSAGFYLLKVIATDGALHTGSAFAGVHAYPPEMARDFTRSSDEPPADPFGWGNDMKIRYDITEAGKRTIRFSVENTPKIPAELSFNWDFGDSTYSTEPIARKTFAKDGVFEVRLIASDGIQNWRKRLWLPISSEVPAAAIQCPAFIEGRAPLRLPWDALVTRGKEPFAYDWSFGEYKRSDPGTVFTFTAPGEYDVNLVVDDRNNEPISAPKVKVRVRGGPAVYRQPLAAVEPANGSTRAVTVAYDGADPLPMTSSATDGAVSAVALSADGEYVGYATADGLVVKRIADGLPTLSFLPAFGAVSEFQPVGTDAAICTVVSATETTTYLVKDQCDPLPLGQGALLSASGDGRRAVLGQRAKPGTPYKAALLALDPGARTCAEPQDIGSLYEARLSRAGDALWMINGEGNLLRRDLASGGDEYIGSREGRRYQLALAALGDAAAWVQQNGERKEIILARLGGDGEFVLSSVTGLTGLFSEHFELGSDGRYLLAYGSRKKLAQMLAAAKGKPVSEDDVMAQPVSGKPRGPLPPARERFGIIRLDLSGDPDSWTLLSVLPRFVVEAQAEFSNVGPF
jgi:PKD domain